MVTDLKLVNKLILNLLPKRELNFGKLKRYSKYVKKKKSKHQA